MTKSTNKSTIKTSVMGKIQKQEIKMKPHYYYTLLSALAVGFIVLAGFISSYAISILSLWLRIQDAAGPAYGAKLNLSNMINGFPWWALLLAIILLVVSIFVVRKVGVLYKIRLAYLVPTILLVVLILGWALSYTSLPKKYYGQHQQYVCSSESVDCYHSGSSLRRGRQMK